jgi:hypothetical protein
MVVRHCEPPKTPKQSLASRNEIASAQKDVPRNDAVINQLGDCSGQQKEQADWPARKQKPGFSASTGIERSAWRNPVS